jgi:hypothetical protein
MLGAAIFSCFFLKKKHILFFSAKSSGDEDPAADCGSRALLSG